MFRKALNLPVCTMALLAATEFATAQSIQPTSPCPPGKVAQNYHRGMSADSKIAQNLGHGAGGAQSAQNSGRDASLQVAGKPIDPLDCR